jgi:hypothetical protein
MWRDLLKFKLGAIFHFAAHASQEPAITALGSQSGYAWFQLTGPMSTAVQAPKDGGYVPYMDVNGNASVKAWMGVLQGKALIGFQAPSLGLGKIWDKDYFSKYKPSDSINLNYFATKITEMVGKKRFLFDLPNIEAGESQVLSPKGFSSDSKWVQLVYQPTTSR